MQERGQAIHLNYMNSEYSGGQSPIWPFTVLHRKPIDASAAATMSSSRQPTVDRRGHLIAVDAVGSNSGRGAMMQ